MKTYTFEIKLTEEDLDGDEFWEDAVAQDGTGISNLTEALENLIDESNLVSRSGKDVLKLVSYSDLP